ncbi:MAG: trehalose-6-phosphate synthase [Terracidiphilus sp.]
MHKFRLRLILALVACVTLVSVASTYFDVLAHKHILRQELARRTQWMGLSIQPAIEQALAASNSSSLTDLVAQAKRDTSAMEVVVYDPHGGVLAFAGDVALLRALSSATLDRSLRKGAVVSSFSHAGDLQWLEEVFPLHNGNQLTGALALITDASYIRSEAYGVWTRSFWRFLALVVLIAGITFAMVRWFLMQPMTRLVERLRTARTGHPVRTGQATAKDLSLFTPLAREVETMAESLRHARAAAEAEARLREAGESLWTAERLAVHMRDNAGDSRIFVVSNREPYVHMRQGKAIVCHVPPSGLVTAIEPVLRACDGVWVASGSGTADAETVDEFDRLRVPPEDPRYTLRRVWLSNEEESNYYDGFSNEGLWPLCHIAHTRPIFRPGDWACYQRVNERFAAALLEEMKDCATPIVFVQDYHFALLPRLIKAARPDARVAIFWHIPWPNPEAFGICPWQAELLDGLLGADLVGFHIPLHCNNFLATVDRTIEARTSREQMTVRRHGHVTAVRPFPISVAFEDPPRVIADEQHDAEAEAVRAALRKQLLAEHGVRVEAIALGVDRMDYTKGIEERMLAFEELLEQHPWHRERLTLVQIAAPSRTRIPSYANFKRRVEEMTIRINQRYQTAHWRPIVLIERQCSHQEVARWYRIADLCLVTSLHDGMNLVAKEYVATRDDEDGVLILSRFTGASVELRDALLVNPYDIAGVADAMHRGLEMTRDERRQRMQLMRRQVLEFNIYRWAASVLRALREVRLEADTTAVALPPESESLLSVEAQRKLA